MSGYAPEHEKRALDRLLSDIFRIDTGTARFTGGSAAEVYNAIDSRIKQSEMEKSWEPLGTFTPEQVAEAKAKVERARLKLAIEDLEEVVFAPTVDPIDDVNDPHRRMCESDR